MFCPQCGKQFAPESKYCSSCGAPATQYLLGRSRLVRPRSPRVIAGVCSGFAIHYGWDLRLLRILLVIATILTSGAGLILYFAFWLLLPDAPYALPPESVYAPATRPGAYPPAL